MKRIIILLLLVNSAYTALKSQDMDAVVNPRIDQRFGVSLKFGGAYTIVGGVAADAFIIPELNIEIDYLPVSFLSVIQYFGGGINVHPWGGRNHLQFSPYTGVFYGHAEGKAFITGDHYEYNALNVPVGVQFTSKRWRMGFDIEMGLALTREQAIHTPEGYKDLVYPTPSVKFRYSL